MSRSLLLPVAFVIVAGLLAGVYIEEAFQDDSIASADPPARQIAERRVLEPYECDSALGLLETTSDTALATLRDSGGTDEQLEMMRQDFTDSIAWAGAGCPDDGVRGYVTTVEGTFYFQLLGRTPEEYGLDRIEFASDAGHD